MGTLRLPASGRIYLDTNAIIYAVEQIAPYAQLLEPVWQAISDTSLVVASSELTLLEALVKPVREGKQALEQRYRRLLTASQNVALYPIDRAVVEQALRLRASAGLRTPDALHAATALQRGCALFLTNDRMFQRVNNLDVVVLDDLLS